MAKNNRDYRTRRYPDEKIARWRPSCVGRCKYCQRRQYNLGRSCGRRDCVGYIDTWLGDWYQCVLQNLLAFDGRVVMATITAPGVDGGMVWDHEACADRGPHQHDGTDGCRVRSDLAEWFNKTADRRFSALHKAAYQRTYRRFGKGALRRLVLTPEPQARGLIHWHLVLAAETAVELAAAQFYVDQLAAMASLYTYGFVDRGQKQRGKRARALVRRESHEALYVAKYLEKLGPKSMRQLVLDRQAPRRAVQIHRELTQTTRCTMRNRRQKRWIWHIWGVGLRAREVHLVMTVLREFDGQLVPYAEPDVAPTRGP